MKIKPLDIQKLWVFVTKFFFYVQNDKIVKSKTGARYISVIHSRFNNL